jgi:hypothetical protein
MDAAEECDGVSLAAMTARGKAGRPCTAEAPREALVMMIRQERAERACAEQAVQGLEVEVQRLGVQIEEQAEDVKDLEEENLVLETALRERTDAEKKAERDARLQGVILRSRVENQKMACDELARRVVEARREIEAVGTDTKNEQAMSSEKRGQEQPTPDGLRKRLLQLLSLGSSTSWADSGSRPTTPAVVPEARPRTPIKVAVMPLGPELPAVIEAPALQEPVSALQQPVSVEAKPVSALLQPLSVEAKRPSTLATCTPTSCDIMSACFQSVFPPSPSEAEHVEEVGGELELPNQIVHVREAEAPVEQVCGELELPKQIVHVSEAEVPVEQVVGELELPKQIVHVGEAEAPVEQVAVETSPMADTTVRAMFAHCPSVGSWLRPVPRLLPAPIAFHHCPSVGTWLRQQPKAFPAPSSEAFAQEASNAVQTTTSEELASTIPFAFCPSTASWVQALPRYLPGSDATQQVINDEEMVKFALCPSAASWVQALPRYLPGSDATPPAISEQVALCTSSNSDMPRCPFVHSASVGAWLCAAPRGEILRSAEQQRLQLMQSSGCNAVDVESSSLDSRAVEDKFCERQLRVDAVETNANSVVVESLLLEGEEVSEAKDESIIKEIGTKAEVSLGSGSEEIERLAEDHKENAKEESITTSTVDYEDDEEEH